MNEESELLRCPDCSSGYDAPDNYCRHCGMYVAALRQSALATVPDAPVQALHVVRPGLPAPVRKAATALAIGAALQVGVGIASRYLATQATREASRLAARPVGRKPGRSPRRGRDLDPIADAAAVSETVIIRRVWIRRS